jgi:hypothetical protein
MFPDVVAFRADDLSGPWSQPFIVSPLNTRTFNSQSGFSIRIEGSKKTTYLYIGDQVRRSFQWIDCRLTGAVGLQLPMGESLHLATNRHRRAQEDT